MLKVDPYGALTLIGIVLAFLCGIGLWIWVSQTMFAHLGIVGLVVGVILAIMVILIFKWREDRDAKTGEK